MDSSNLFPFQQEGVDFLKWNNAALLCDEMGLGKTAQTLVAADTGGPVMIVCPASLKSNWAAEAKTWMTNPTIEILSGKGSFRWPEPGEVLITNYELLPDGVQTDEAPLNTILVADEAHYLKNRRASRTKLFTTISWDVRIKQGKVWLLTGTPLLNSPIDLWSVLSAAGIHNKVFGNWIAFTKAFSGYRTQFGWRFAGPRVGVRDMLNKVMLRRTRKEVLPDLPPMRWMSMLVPISETVIEECDEVWDDLHAAGITASRIGDVVQLSSLGNIAEVSAARKTLAAAKVPEMLRIVESYRLAQEPLVVFSAHRLPIDMLEVHKGWGVITGDTPAAKRGKIVQDFQAGRLIGIAGTINAMGVGHTLTRAAHMLFVDREWVPAWNRQAEDRIMRIGQDRGCLVTDLVADHPLDRHVYQTLQKKRVLVGYTLEEHDNNNIFIDHQ